MNYGTLQERCWNFLSQANTAGRADWKRQEIRDALNEVLYDVAGEPPFIWNLVREFTFDIVPNQSVYTLDDWIARPLALRTEDSNAHRVIFRNWRAVDRDGSRATGAVDGPLGPWQVTWYPRTSAALKSGAAASATEGSTSITGLSGLNASDVGRMLRLNGEETDYKIVSQSVTACVVDRAVRSRLSGEAVLGVGLGYSSVRWEISPPGRYRLEFVPKPTMTKTVHMKALVLPRLLLQDNETPEILTERHHLLWKGALRQLSALMEESENWQRYATEYQDALRQLRANEQDDADNEEGPWIETLYDRTGRFNRNQLNGASWRADAY